MSYLDGAVGTPKLQSGAKRWHLWDSSLPKNQGLQALEELALILGSSLEQALTSSHFSSKAKLLVFC